ncbi:MAG: glycosyltransferase, partial [Candidatus Bathyarchaeia archaeon]
SLAVFSLVRKVKTDIILIPNNTLPNLLSGFVASVAFRRPACVVVHHVDTPFKLDNSDGSSLYETYRSLTYGKLVSLVKTLATYTTLFPLRRAWRIIAVSNFTAKVLVGAGVLKSKICVSGNAINSDFIEAVTPYCGQRQFHGVFVGRIAVEKGIFDLLLVWKEVVKVKKDAQLLIIGSGLELSFLRKKIAALDLQKNVRVFGRCEDKELYSLLKSCKVFIFPSLFEGWGIAVAEALTCGLPVVAYDIPALREVFGKCKSVFLVPVKDVWGMSSAILKILNKNKKEFGKLSFNSKVYSRRFSWEKIAKKDLKFLRSSFIKKGEKW